MTQKVSGSMLAPGAVVDADTGLTIGNYVRVSSDGTLEERTPTEVRSDIGAGTGSGSVTSVAAAQPAAGLTISGSPITNSGTLTFALANDLAALEALNTNGMIARTGTDAMAARTVTGTAGRIDVTNGNGVSGNPTINIPTTLIDSGTYTPTASTFTNIDTAVPRLHQYMRVGSVVTVSGITDIDATAGGGLNTQFEITLPVASNLGVSGDCVGVGSINDTTYISAQVFGSFTNDRAVIRYNAVGTGALTIMYTFTYRII